MIGFENAQACVRQRCALQPAEAVALAEGLGRVLAHDVLSSCDLPPFDNSAMDGFALRCGAETLRAGAEFVVRGEQAAGDSAHAAQGEGTWEIMTGARIPDGLDAVVPVEQVEVLSGRADGRAETIRLNADVTPGQHVRRAGQDIACGAMAIPAGTLLEAQHLMLLSGLGVARIEVRARPHVALLCTGRELVDDPAIPLQPGQIRNSNGPFLASRVEAAGGQLVYRETVPDDAAAFEQALARALAAGASIVISTGAVSMGRYDFVPPTLKALEAEIVFHKVAMRPGKPLLFAQLVQGQLYFGLPGNPVSSVLGFRFFVEAALRVKLGLAPEAPWQLPLAHATHKKPGFRMLQKARLHLSAQGQLAVELLQGQESFKTQSLLAATCWALLPEAVEHLEAGTRVQVVALGHERNSLWGGQGA